MSTILDFPIETADVLNVHEYAPVLSDFLLTGDLKGYRERLKKRFPSKAALLCDHIDGIVGSLENRNLWRAVAYTRRYRCPLDVACARFQVDVRLCDRVIMLASDDALTTLFEIADSGSVLEVFTDAEEADILKRLTAFSRQTVFTKLKFLISYDTSLDAEDYIQTLLLKGMTTVWRYSHFTKTDGIRDTLKIVNYAKAAIHNTAMSLIRTNTLDSKARIKNHMEACGVCPACKRNDPMQCYTSEPHYEATVVSVDSEASKGYAAFAAEDSGAFETRAILANVISRDPAVAATLMKQFGSTDLGAIVEMLDEYTPRQLASMFRNVG